MTNANLFDIEAFWAALLSEEPTEVQAAWASLAADERPAVLAHLQQMATEPDWSEPQRRSATAALQVLTPPAA